MTPPIVTLPAMSSVAALDTQADIERRERILDDIFARWRESSTPDALAELENHPELGHSKSVILELACEEFWLRSERGESPSVQEFIRRFPGHSTGLNRFLAIGSQLDVVASFRPERREWPTIGTVYRGFRLQERLGRGAFSCVYLAEDTSLADRQVVLKLTTLPGNEPEALGRLRHNNVVPVYAYYPPESAAVAMLVMPYCGRTTLEDLLDRIRLEPELPYSMRVLSEFITDVANQGGRNIASRLLNQPFVEAALRLTHGLCLGLAEAHEQQLLHLDIKPSNVLLANDATLKLLDFNLTQVTDQMPTSAMGGTLAYMSPEQQRTICNHTVGILDARSDLYSLGIVLYELLTARHPFGPLDPTESAKVTADLLQQRRLHGVRSIREFNPWVNESCARLIESCLAEDPNDRPPSARALAQKLAAELRWPAKARRLRIRYPRGAYTVATAVLLFVVGVAYGASQYPEYDERCYLRACAAAREGRWVDAIGLLTSGLDFDSTHDVSRLMRARCLAAAGRDDEAIADFQALERGSFAVAARSGLIYCFIKLNKLDDAVKVANSDLTRQELTSADLNNLAYGYMYRGDYDAARSYLDRAIALAPDCIQARFNRALTEWKRTKLWPNYSSTAGIRDLEIAVSREKYWEFYFYLTLLHLAGGADAVEARQSAEEALTEAVRCGMPPALFKKVPEFRNLNVLMPQDVPERQPFSRLIAPPVT